LNIEEAGKDATRQRLYFPIVIAYYISSSTLLTTNSFASKRVLFLYYLTQSHANG